MDKTYERRRRIGIILASIEKVMKVDKVVSETKIIQECIKEFGVSFKTAKEYLNELELLDYIVRYKDEIWTKEKWDKVGNILTKQRTLPDIEEKEMNKEKKEREELFDYNKKKEEINSNLKKEFNNAGL